MEYLYQNSQGKPVAGFEEITIKGVQRVALNQKAYLIPKEAYNKLNYQGLEAPTDKSGVFKAMEWSHHPDWHSLDFHWCPYIPVRAPQFISTPWYLQVYCPAAIKQMNQSFIFDCLTAEDFARDNKESRGMSVRNCPE
jgi:hypothetical protein